MWLTQVWIAVIVSCTSPGAADESCQREAVQGFVHLAECLAAVEGLSRLTEHWPPSARRCR